jgi:hypothetical protein
LPWQLGTLGLLAIPVLVLWWPGCRQYPEVTSKESLKLIKQLYTACNTRDSDRLAKVEERLAKIEADGKMSEREVDAFRAIIDLAREGEWERAERASFKFAQDQVR